MRVVLLLGLTGWVALSPTFAEDVEKRFRIGLAAGMFNAQDDVTSDSANNLRLLDSTLQFINLYTDPRNDAAARGSLELKSDVTATLYGQYALSKIFIVEASVGYQKTDFGDVEVQAQFDGVDLPEIGLRFKFDAFRIPVGEVERVPLQFTGLARFRPQSSFNPYVGGGIGYTFIGFEPDPAFNELSVRMDASRGALAEVTSSFTGNAAFLNPPQTDLADLDGARIDAQDTWEWHLVAGSELSIKRKWTLFFDLRYTFSSRSIEVGFNGGKDLGVRVPQFTDISTFPAGCSADPLDPTCEPDLDKDGERDRFGAIRIAQGGLIDGGSLQPEPERGGVPGETDCAAQPALCTFQPVLDGELDTGYYYAQGGSVEYGGVAAQIGVRFTF